MSLVPELAAESVHFRLVMYFSISGTAVAVLSTVMSCLSNNCLLMFQLDVTVEKFVTLLNVQCQFPQIHGT